MTDPRHIGDIKSSPMGFGTWAIGGPFAAPDGQPLGWGVVDDDESVAAVRAAFDAGITLFDTANVYGTGHAERILARALAGRRDEVVLATKWGNTMQEEAKLLDGSDGSVASMRTSLEGSLRRLKTDYVDLFQFHLNGFDGPVDALQEALEELAEEGTIRGYGWSTDHPDRAQMWVGGKHYCAVQAEINVLNDNAGILNVAEANGLACLNRGPLAMGLLSGKYTAGSKLGVDDVRGKTPEWLRYFNDGVPSPEFLAKLDSVREILTANDRSLVQGAIAWLWGAPRQRFPSREYARLPRPRRTRRRWSSVR